MTGVRSGGGGEPERRRWGDIKGGKGRVQKSSRKKKKAESLGLLMMTLTVYECERSVIEQADGKMKKREEGLKKGKEIKKKE